MSRGKVALENQFRKMIFAHIVEYPGVSFSKLKRIFDLNESTLRYHLNYLIRTKKMSSKIEFGKLHYYPYASIVTDSNTANLSSKAIELTAHQELILNKIKQYPGINQTELMEKTALQRHILTYNISQLIDFGMVKKNNHARTVCYEYITNEQLQFEMLKVLTIKLLNNEIDEEAFLKMRNKLKND